jgi:6-pyruvoyltetrahydropterin/6-carboxytetrahydropterin synthase
MKIGRIYHFESAHRLPMVPETHRCRNLHGHNYKVEIVIDGLLNNDGMVIDFFDLDHLMIPILNKIDHQYLNDILGLENPTAENISLWIFEKLLPFRATTVRVWETDCCWAECGDNRKG